MAKEKALAEASIEVIILTLCRLVAKGGGANRFGDERLTKADFPPIDPTQGQEYLRSRNPLVLPGETTQREQDTFHQLYSKRSN